MPELSNASWNVTSGTALGASTPGRGPSPTQHVMPAPPGLSELQQAAAPAELPPLLGKSKVTLASGWAAPTEVTQARFCLKSPQLAQVRTAPVGWFTWRASERAEN